MKSYSGELGIAEIIFICSIDSTFTIIHVSVNFDICVSKDNPI